MISFSIVFIGVIFKKKIRLLLLLTILIFNYCLVFYLTRYDITLDRFATSFIVVSLAIAACKSIWNNKIVTLLAIVIATQYFMESKERFFQDHSGWKEAAIDLCFPQKIEPLFAWGGPKIEYYFPKNCVFYRFRHIPPFALDQKFPFKKGYILVNKFSADYLLNFKSDTFKIGVHKTYGAESRFPVLLLEFTNSGK
jgi:hypothetical protein